MNGYFLKWFIKISMRMKKIYLFLLMSAFAGSLFAQRDASNDPDAKKILDGVSEKFKSYKAVQANFTYKVENSDGKTISSKKGTVFMKGKKYRVSFVGQEIYCDGNTV